MISSRAKVRSFILGLPVKITVIAVTLLSNQIFAAPSSENNSLKTPASFEKIKNKTERSQAIFEEMGKVLLHPRCVNCHPNGLSPTQGMDMHQHEPPVTRGLGGMGQFGMFCNTCHLSENVRIYGQSEDIKSIPGNPAWHLAPAEMVWAGKTLGEICEQIKDKKRNGGKNMKDLHHHMAHDELVGWGWHPGEGREPVPGTQKQFGELFSAWISSGAVCPK